MTAERLMGWALLAIALVGLATGLAAQWAGMPQLAAWAWTLSTLPVMAGLAIAIVKGFLSREVGVDAIAFIAMGAALVLGQPLAGAVVALMYSGGTLLEIVTVSHAERELKSLVNRAPRVAHRFHNGALEDVDVAAFQVGDRMLVHAGEIIPLDGFVASASALVDESALTGEPIPVRRTAGAALLSGSVNAGDSFEMVASALAGDSTYAGIVRLVAEAQTAKAPFVRLAERYALFLLPFTLAVSAAAWLISGDLTRSLAVLVAATPCPLILAAPIAFIAGVARAARQGILIKGGRPLEALARAHTVLFDKTGTLTIGGARLVSVQPAPGWDGDEVLGLAASLEQTSHHVLAKAVVSACLEKDIALKMPDRVRENVGAGLTGCIDGKKVSAGSREMIFGARELPDWAQRAVRRASWRSALSVFVSVDDEPAGALLLADELRTEAPRAIRRLREAGIARVVMVTGDDAAAAETIGSALDIDSVLANRLPSDKVDAVRLEQRFHPTVMIGDGINDAPALAAADVGIAMGARGASASSEAADVVTLSDRLDLVADVIVIAQRSRSIAIQSIWAGMGLSVAAMFAAMAGILAPVPAAVLQEVIDVAVIFNALRALRAPHARRGRAMPAATRIKLELDHRLLALSMDRLRSIADALDDAAPDVAKPLVEEANAIIQKAVVVHEHEDDATVYPQLAKYVTDTYGLSAMGRAHREILHLARLLEHILTDMEAAETADRFILRDAQRAIEAIEALVRMHSAQEDELYESISEASQPASA